MVILPRLECAPFASSLLFFFHPTRLLCSAALPLPTPKQRRCSGVLKARWRVENARADRQDRGLLATGRTRDECSGVPAAACRAAHEWRLGATEPRSSPPQSLSTRLQLLPPLVRHTQHTHRVHKGGGEASAGTLRGCWCSLSHSLLRSPVSVRPSPQRRRIQVALGRGRRATTRHHR